MGEAGKIPCFCVLAGANGAGKSTFAGDVFLRPHAKPVWPKGTITKQGERLELAIAQRCDYSFQTPLSNKTITGQLEMALSAGIEVRIWYVGLSSPELHIARVRARGTAGGKNIPGETIRNAYYRSRHNLIRLLPRVTELRLYDNSEEADPDGGVLPYPHLILHVVKGSVQNVCGAEGFPDWVKPIIEAFLKLPEQSAS